MATEWRSRGVDIRLPRATLERMWERARRSFDVKQGGRYDARSRTTILLWSGRLTNPGAEPVGAFCVRWNGGAPDEAAIWQVAWTPRRGGSESQVWRAIQVLAGADWPSHAPARRRVRPDDGRQAA